jgi:uncharacterized phage protein (TIGR02220 family)
MTKEEAWMTFLNGIAELNGDVLHPEECDVEDAFNWGWHQALESIKKPEEEIIPFNSIIQNMNSILEKNFKVTLAHKSHIRARWSEGHREQDFDRVVRTKAAQWKNDPQMAIYLRPETLFGSRFDSYLNEPAPKKTRIVTNHMGVEVEVEDV